jgi:hypothetical protein
MTWKIDRYTALLLAGNTLVAFCGTSIGLRIGLHGLDQWSVAGYSLGLMMASGQGALRLRQSVRDLRARIESLEHR